LVFAAAGILSIAVAVPGTWGGLIVAGGPVLVAAAAAGKVRDVPLPAAAVCGLALVLSARGIDRVFVSAGVADFLPVMRAAAVGGYAAAWALLAGLAAGANRGRLCGGVFVAVVGCAVVLRAGAIFSTPHSLHDVNVCVRGAADHLLAGRNPYSQCYADQYGSELNLPPGEPVVVPRGAGKPVEFTRLPDGGVVARAAGESPVQFPPGAKVEIPLSETQRLVVRTWRGQVRVFVGPPGRTDPTDLDAYPAYPPLPFLAAVPFRAAGWDWRWALVIGDLAAAAALAAAARRGAPELGVGAAAAYLFMPNVPLLYDVGWYEPLIAGSLAAGFLAADRGWRAGHLLLALGLTAKQSGVVVLLPLLKALRGSRVALCAAVAAVVAATVVPFFLWEPVDFLTVVYFKHADAAVRSEGITVYNLLGYWLGVAAPPRAAVTAISAALIALVVWRTPPQLRAAPLGAGTALTVFYFFHTGGFYNYYYLCFYLLLLGVAWREADPPAKEAAAVPK
jgi:hypothetical protein